jgi:hypothetical protein
MAELEEHRDRLPEDLNLDEYVGVTAFPDPGRRRFVGGLWLAVAAVTGVVVAANGTDGVLVNKGLLFFAVGTALIGLYHFAAGAGIKLREADALAIASRQVGFPIGHASAQLGFQGLLSRPTWRILLYSAENPPRKRGMVLIDGRSAAVLGDYVEDNPEDPKIWAGS